MLKSFDRENDFYKCENSFILIMGNSRSRKFLCCIRDDFANLPDRRDCSKVLDLLFFSTFQLYDVQFTFAPSEPERVIPFCPSIGSDILTLTILYCRYHNNTMINFLKGVTVVTGQVGGAEGAGRDELWVAPPNTTVSSLTIRSTLRDHAGNYTCAPPHATSDSVRLYVTNGELSCHCYEFNIREII